MANHSKKPAELIPPPELAPPSVKHLSLAKRVEIWAQLVDETDAFVRAGLQAKVGSTTDLCDVYREWYARSMCEHEKSLYQFAENLTRLEANHGQ